MSTPAQILVRLGIAAASALAGVALASQINQEQKDEKTQAEENILRVSKAEIKKRVEAYYAYAIDFPTIARITKMRQEAVASAVPSDLRTVECLNYLYGLFAEVLDYYHVTDQEGLTKACADFLHRTMIITQIEGKGDIARLTVEVPEEAITFITPASVVVDLKKVILFMGTKEIGTATVIGVCDINMQTMELTRTGDGWYIVPFSFQMDEDDQGNATDEPVFSSEDSGAMKKNYFTPTNYVLEEFFRTLNKSPEDKQKWFADSLKTPGTIIDFDNGNLSRPDAEKAIVHGTFSFDEVIRATHGWDNDGDMDLTATGTATLIEYLSTGFYYGIYKEEGEYAHFEIFDFSGSKEHPTEVYQFSEMSDEPLDVWIPADPMAPGTRFGGLPLNSDGTLYDGPWPGAKDGTMVFVCQYQLEDGRYVHVFQNYDASEYDYSDNMPDDEGDERDPYSVVLVDGKCFGTGFIVASNSERKSFSPNEAFGRKPSNFTKKYPPVWVQDPDPANDPDYEFLLHFGWSTTCNGEIPLMHELSGSEYYLYLNRKTGRAKVLMQCT